MPNTERRAARRFSSNLRLVVQGTDVQGKRFCEMTTSINVSSDGVYFLLNQPVNKDSHVSVTIIQPQGRNIVRLSGHGRVVRRVVVERHELSGSQLLDPCLAVRFVESLRGTLESPPRARLQARAVSNQHSHN